VNMFITPAYHVHTNPSTFFLLGNLFVTEWWTFDKTSFWSKNNNIQISPVLWLFKRFNFYFVFFSIIQKEITYQKCYQLTKILPFFFI